jgi:hypothetical protein
MTKIILCASFSLLFYSSLHAQQAANVISYQGLIQGVNGATVKDSTYPITVSIWTDASSGPELWRDIFQTEVKNGIFNIMLGSQNPLPPSTQMDKPLWVSVSVGGSMQLSYRARLSAVPMAINVVDGAITTTKLAPGSITPDKLNMDYISSVSVNGEKITSKGANLDIVGNGGIMVSYEPDSNRLFLTGTGSKGQQAPVILSDPCAGTNGIGGVNTNTVAGGCSNIANPSVGYATISGGLSNTVNSPYAAIGGGMTNKVATFSDYSFIGAGTINLIDTGSLYSAIAGGDSNGIAGMDNDIAGGHYNAVGVQPAYLGPYAGGIMVPSNFASIGGGRDNFISGSDGAHISGGTYNEIGLFGNPSLNAVIGGGDTNRIEISRSAVIAGGSSNTINQSTNSVIGGGLGNQISAAHYSVIAGGNGNKTQQPYSTVSGGFINRAEANATTVGGDIDNIVCVPYGTIGGGDTNYVRSWFGTIGGGWLNGAGIDLNDSATVVAGGYFNHANNNFAAITGGEHNTSADTATFVGGGSWNAANQAYSTIGGGRMNNIGDDFLDNHAVSSTIVGGDTNFIDAFCTDGFIGGGRDNAITLGYLDDGNPGYFPTPFATIAGGYIDTIYAGDTASFIGGGEHNIIDTNSYYSTLAGGYLNSILQNSQA